MFWTFNMLSFVRCHRSRSSDHGVGTWNTTFIIIIIIVYIVYLTLRSISHSWWCLQKTKIINEMLVLYHYVYFFENRLCLNETLQTQGCPQILTLIRGQFDPSWSFPCAAQKPSASQFWDFMTLPIYCIIISDNVLQFHARMTSV